MSKSPEIGSRRWWLGEAHWTPRGTIDCCLRLLEQGEITRNKCLELVRHSIMTPSTKEAPKAPWHNLNWGEVGDE